MFRKLPTLKFDAYKHAADELLLVLSMEGTCLLKLIGGNKRLLARTLSTFIKQDPYMQDTLQQLIKRGYVLEEAGWEDIGIDGMRPSMTFSVNWKQIRQLNKAISLL